MPCKKRKKKLDLWIQEAVKRPERVRSYMKRKYGKRAFTKSGKIKKSYLHRAVKETKSRSLRSALLLALRFRKMKK
jgi:hypothetical protein